MPEQQRPNKKQLKREENRLSDAAQVGLRASDSKHTLISLAKNKDINQDTQRQLATHADEDVRAALIKNPALAPEIKEDMFHKDTQKRIELAKQLGLRAEKQLELAKDKAVDVRRELARNPSIVVAAQLELAKDEDVEVRRELAENPSVAIEAQLALAKDKGEVRFYLTRNPSLVLKAQLILAKDIGVFIRCELAAGNPNLAPEAQLILAKDEDVSVRRCLTRNTNMAIEVQLVLAKDVEPSVRSCLAENPNTDSVALKMCRDETVVAAPQPAHEYSRHSAFKPDEDEDNVNKPAHYQGKVECIDALEVVTEGLSGLDAVCTANTVKYLWRWNKKNGLEDLKKAKWYLERLISRVEGREDE